MFLWYWFRNQINALIKRAMQSHALPSGKLNAQSFSYDSKNVDKCPESSEICGTTQKVFIFGVNYKPQEILMDMFANEVSICFLLCSIIVMGPHQNGILRHLTSTEPDAETSRCDLEIMFFEQVSSKILLTVFFYQKFCKRKILITHVQTYL